MIGWMKPLDGGGRNPSFGGLELDNSALEADGDGVSPIICAELRKYVRHVTLNGCFSDRELICDLLICVPGSDQPQYVDFA